MIQRNVQNKSKNGIKVSVKTDSNGVALSLAIGKGATNDSKIAIEQANSDLTRVDTKKVRKNNKYKQKLICDAQYHSKEFIEKYEKKGYKVQTDVNIRNTKNEESLEELKIMKEEYLKIASERSTVERSFAWLHKYPKLDRFVEKTVNSYIGLLLLGASLTVSKKIE